MKSYFLKLLSLSLLFAACKNGNDKPVASGSFEAVETIVSAEVNGKILELNVEEGDVLKQSQRVGYIDSTQLYLNKMQLVQNRKAILSGMPDVKTQLDVLYKELNNALSDKQRIENLVKGNVASQKQLDDANTRIAVLQSKIAAQKSTLTSNTSTITEQSNTVEIQLAQVEDQLRRCIINNPVNGTVLAKYANTYEMTAAGKPLYKIADLNNIILRAYITGNQLSTIKLNQKVKVLTDDSKGVMKETEGIITWISDKAEFTPKTIRTKDERANLVYAIKINVKNDGTYKIGMYGEIKL